MPQKSPKEMLSGHKSLVPIGCPTKKYTDIVTPFVRGNVLERVGGDFGRDRTFRILKNNDSAFQSTRALRLFAPFPGSFFIK